VKVALLMGLDKRGTMKKLSSEILICVALLLVSASNSFGLVVTHCSGSEGYSYYFKSPLGENKDIGWGKDSISKGEIIFMIKNEKPEIIYKDAFGTRSTTEDGSKLSMLQSVGRDTIVLVSNSNLLETYRFHLDANGNGEVAWGSNRGGILPKSSLMVSKCKK
jgi:hypothetical protein